MQCFYHDYIPTVGPQCLVDNNVYFPQTHDFEIQQKVKQTRYHPYMRRQYSVIPDNSTMTGQYQHHFDPTSQLPVYRDFTPDTYIQTDWYHWNKPGYCYPYLNFLHEGTSGINPGEKIYNETVSPTQTIDLDSQLYPDIGQNFSHFQPVVSSKTVLCANVGQIRTRDKYRVVYTDSQKVALEKEYEKNVFITENRRSELSEEINLSERQIKFWFQNRRVKDRRGKTAKAQKQKENTKTVTQKGRNNRNAVSKQNQANGVPKDHLSCRFSDRLSCTQDDNQANMEYNGENMLEIEDIKYQFPQNYNEIPSGFGEGYPKSPSEWAALSETNLLTTLNVSPILTSVEGDHLVRS